VDRPDDNKPVPTHHHADTVQTARTSHDEIDLDLGVPDAAAAADDAAAAPLPAASFVTSKPGTSPEELPTIGHIGRYALKYRIGEGGLGTVFAAYDPLLSRLIAIKTLNVDIAPESRQSFDSLFLNEARAAGGLSHPHIVTVFDAGISDQGVYIAMELLKGRDLRQLRQEGWKPTPPQAAMIARRVADALAYAHAKGVVHRDIKPANIFMVGRTQPRVLDFGIARIAHQHDMLGDESITAGSPYYMAPEQLRHEPIDRRGDVFSLGVVLYELLTGRKPFSGATLSEIGDAVLNHEPPLAHEVNPAVPPALSAIAARAMEKSPERRYRSARGMSRELRHWLDEHTQASDVAAEARAATPPSPATPRALWAAVAAGALLLAGSAWWWTGTPAAPEGPTPNEAATTQPPADLALAAPRGPEPAAADATPVAATPPSGLALAAAAPPRPATAPPRGASKGADAPRRVAKPAPSPSATPSADAPAATPATGVVHVAVTPWGQIEVDGRDAGTTPPTTQLTLTEGAHQITIRNADFPPHSVRVNVSATQPVTLKHRF
jgi:serine/threonine-protein kinase